MTDHDAIAARVRQDRETGTPGPWRIHNCESYGYRCTTFFQEIWNEETDIIVTTEVTRAHNDGGAANMRRIAALPDLETAYLDLYDKVQRLLAVLDEIATAASGIARDIQIGPDDEGRDIYEMVLAIRDDARAALSEISALTGGNDD